MQREETSPDPAPPRPAFRALEVHRIEDGPEPGLVLSDPLGLFEGQVFVPEGLLPVVERLDGRRTVPDIERELRQLGVGVPDGLVAGVVRDFEEALLLDGELFRNTLERTVEAFLGSGSRPARHPGTAGYPSDPEECAAALTALVGPPLAEDPAPGLGPRGVISPHVDLARGAAVYGPTWRSLAAAGPLADLYVVLGTGHQGPARPLTGLELDWQTPRGTLRTATGFVEQVHDRLGVPTDLERYLHRNEHSIEFQMLLLAHLAADLPEAERPRVAGFLCGSMAPEAAAAILEVLRGAAAAYPGRVCFVAGADLAHLGPVFGDDGPADETLRDGLAARDAARLERLGAGDASGFRHLIDREDNADRVCSVTALQLVSALCGPASHPLLYGQTPESPEQVVSFAGGLLT